MAVTLAAEEYSHFTGHISAGASVPLGVTANYTGAAFAFAAGAGYRWSHRQSVSIEYLAYDQPFKDSLVKLLKPLSPKTTLCALNGAYRLDLRTSGAIQPYVTAGGGWYHRVTTLTAPSAAAKIACSPLLLWWHLGCVAGFVDEERIVGNFSANALGFFGGAGLSHPITLGGPKLYIEFRYLNAAYPGVPARGLPLLVGVSW